MWPADKLRTFDRVVAAVESDPTVASRVFVDGAGNPVADESSRRYWISQSTWTFVGAYFRHATTLDFDSARFEPLFGLLCEQAARNDVAVTGVSPLLNVDVTPGDVTLQPSLLIRPAFIDEIESWINPTYHAEFEDQPLTVNETMGLHYVVEHKFVKQRFSYAEENTAEDSVSQLITLLRLVTDCGLYAPFTQYNAIEVFHLAGNAITRRDRWNLRQPVASGTLDDRGAAHLVSL